MLCCVIIFSTKEKAIHNQFEVELEVHIPKFNSKTQLNVERGTHASQI